MPAAACLCDQLLVRPPEVPPCAPEDSSTAPVGRARTETEVVALLLKAMWLHNATASTKARVLCTLLKLTVRFTSPSELSRIRSVRGTGFRLCSCHHLTTVPRAHTLHPNPAVHTLAPLSTPLAGVLHSRAGVSPAL